MTFPIFSGCSEPIPGESYYNLAEDIEILNPEDTDPSLAQDYLVQSRRLLDTVFPGNSMGP